MNTNDLQVIGDYDGSVGVYCTTCHPSEDPGAILTLKRWRGSVSLTDVIAAAAGHASDPAHHAKQEG